MQPRSNLAAFAADLRASGNPYQAAAVNAIRGDLAAAGLDWDVASERARNIAMALVGCDSEAERARAVTEGLSKVQSVVLANVVHQVLRSWERWAEEEGQNDGNSKD